MTSQLLFVLCCLNWVPSFILLLNYVYHETQLSFRAQMQHYKGNLPAKLTEHQQNLGIKLTVL